MKKSHTREIQLRELGGVDENKDNRFEMNSNTSEHHNGDSTSNNMKKKSQVDSSSSSSRSSETKKLKGSKLLRICQDHVSVEE